VIATADGGKTWVEQDSPTQARLLSVSCVADCRRVWAVGENGTVIASASDTPASH
jgi:photosystem II stability/assembly factor-like uncharacterized protein